MRKARPLGELAVEMNPQKELIDALQAKVSAWVAEGYAGVSELSHTLLRYWFGEPHLMTHHSRKTCLH